MSGPIALTGSTGFVGRHLVRKLSEAGFDLRLLVRDASQDCGCSSAETITGDLADERALQRLVSGSTAVIHLAGVIAAPNRGCFFAINSAGSERLAKAAKRAGVRRFIHVSSLAAREPQLSDYGASKRTAEEVLLALDATGLVIVRPPVIYGPGDRATLPLIAQLTRRKAFIPGDPKARFSLLFVEDLVRDLIARLADNTQGVVEIDDGHGGYSWPQLLAMAGRSEGHVARPIYVPRWLLAGLAWPVGLAGSGLKLRVPLTPGKVRELYHLDWVARTASAQLPDCLDFTEGFGRTVAWYREQGWLPRRRGADRRQPANAHGEAK